MRALIFDSVHKAKIWLAGRTDVLDVQVAAARAEHYSTVVISVLYDEDEAEDHVSLVADPQEGAVSP